MDPSSSPCLYDLSPRTILRLSGPDRERYLNGQVTQDVRLATADQAVFSCVLDPKGRLAAVCHIREHEDSYLIDAPLDLREDLFARLDRYIIADDVELSDESDDWHLGHLVTRDAPEGNLHWRCTRLGPSGFDLLAREPISLQGVREMSAEHFDWVRTVSGIPAWGAELTPGLLPPDARLEDRAISYDKGCYLGQEVISRMKKAGKTNQMLTLISVPGGTRPPCTLIREGKDAGRITSVATRPGEPPVGPEGSVPALGFVRRKFAALDPEQFFELSDQEGNPLPGKAFVHPPTEPS